MISECFMRYAKLGTNPVFQQKTQDVTPESGTRSLELTASKCGASLLFLPLAVFVQNSGTHAIPKDSDWTVRGGVWHGYFQKLLHVSNFQPGLRSHFPYHLGTCQFSIFQLFPYQHYWILIFYIVIHAWTLDLNFTHISVGKSIIFDLSFNMSLETTFRIVLVTGLQP